MKIPFSWLFESLNTESTDYYTHAEETEVSSAGKDAPESMQQVEGSA